MSSVREVSEAQLSSLIDLLKVRHGYDFQHYAMSSFRRRVLRVLDLQNLTIDELMHRLIHEPYFITDFLGHITVSVTEMFRDPLLWRFLRHELLPQVVPANRPFRIWHAGCSSGQEVLSIAILLRELGFKQDAVDVVATDIDLQILAQARSATYPAKHMEVNQANYAKTDGKARLEQYYQADGTVVHFDQSLLQNVSFLKHDLVTDDVFGQYDLILCRNVLIYFDQELQNDVARKFHRSLKSNGHLAIGSKESLAWCDVASRFLVVNNDEKVYRKVRD